jgi:hypothetical protein
VKKIIVDGSEIEVLDYQWITEPYKAFNKIAWKLETFSFNIDYIKVKISRQNCKEILKKILSANEYVIEADYKKAKFYLHIEETKRLFDWHKSESDEIEIQFIGTVNDV